MAQVRITGPTAYLSANHAQRTVCVFDNEPWVDGFKVAWPPTTGVKLCVGRKKGCFAANAAVNTSGPVIPELTRKGTLGAILAGNIVCFGRKCLAPFLLSFVEFFHCFVLIPLVSKGSFSWILMRLTHPFPKHDNRVRSRLC